MLIGICGKARAGKDTFGGMLAEELYERTGNRHILMAYATELKKKVQEDFDLSFEQLWGNQKEVPDERYSKPDDDGYWTAREIMQNYGQFFRTIDYNFWVKNLFRVIRENNYENVIITDVRHPNEADPVKDQDGIVIRIVRDVETDVHNQQHISEVAMDSYDEDIRIVNSGTLDDLRETARDIVDMLLNKKMEIKI